MSKIRLLDTGGKNEIVAAILDIKRQLPEIIEHMTVMAEIRKASYDASIEHGFTPEQALELCKSAMTL